jgi:hypothetical protein
MALAHTLRLASLALVLSATRLVAQADSTRGIPDLAGRWRLTRPWTPGVLFATFSQTGHQLRVNIVRHRRCADREVKVELTLLGAVDADTVRFWSASRRLEGDFGNPCVLYTDFSGSVDFAGPLSADGKRFQGTYDDSGEPTHVWVFSR